MIITKKMINTQMFFLNKIDKQKKVLYTYITLIFNYYIMKKYFSDDTSFFISRIILFLIEWFYFFYKTIFIFLIIWMLFYLFKNSWINTFDLFVDMWIKDQYTIIYYFGEELFILFILFFCKNRFEYIYNKYEFIFYNKEEV